MLPDYSRWPDSLDTEEHASFNMRYGTGSEYDDHRTVAQQGDDGRKLRNDEDFFCIGKHIKRGDLGK